MCRRLFLVICLLCFGHALKAQKDSACFLLPVKQNKKWGFIDERGRIVIPPSFDHAGDFNNCLAVVKKEGKYGIINTTGRLVVQPLYDGIKFLNNSLIAVRNDSLWGITDYSNRVLVAPRYTAVEPAGSAFVAVYNERDQGLLDSLGQEIVPCGFDTIYQVRNKFFVAFKNGKYGAWNKQGKMILPAEYAEMELESDSLLFYRKTNLWGCCLTNGEELFKPEWLDFQLLCDGIAKLKNDNGWKLYSFKEKKFWDKNYDDYNYLGGSWLTTLRNDSIGLFSDQLQEVFPPRYDEVEIEGEGLFRIRRDQLYGLAAADGVLAEPCVDSMGTFRNNLAVVAKQKKRGIMNSRGKLLVSPENETISIRGTTAKVYRKRGDAVTVVDFDEQGNLLERNAFENLSTIRIGQPAPRSGGQSFGAAANTERIDKFEWFYSAAEKTWGLRVFGTDSVIIPPSFLTITVKPKINATLVEVKGPEATLSFGITDFDVDTRFGLVDNRTGKYLIKPVYWAIRTTELEDKRLADFAVCMKAGGSLAMVSLRGGFESHGRANFIGPFIDGRARAVWEARPELSAKQNSETVCTLRDYLLSFDRGWKTSNGYWYGGYEPVYLCFKGGYWGYIDKENRSVPSSAKDDDAYLFARDFNNGYGIAKTKNGWGVSSAYGRVIDFQYDDIVMMGEKERSFFKVQKRNARYSYINKEGDVVLDPVISEGKNCSEGMIAVKIGGKWGYMDSLGKLLIDAVYAGAKDFHSGFAAVKMKSRWGYIDLTGDTLIAPSYQFAGDFNEGYARVQQNGKYGYIDQNGKLVIPFTFTKAEDFSHSLAVVGARGKFGLIDKKGNWVVKPQYSSVIYSGAESTWIASRGRHSYLLSADGKKLNKRSISSIAPFSEGLAKVQRKKRFGYMDALGSMVIPAEYTHADRFSEGLAKVSVKGKYGYIDANGQLKIEPAFQKCTSFSNGRAIAWKQGRAGIIDEAGTWVVKPSWNNAKEFRSGLAVVNDSLGYWSLIDKNGHKVFRDKFENVVIWDERLVWVKQKGKWGLFDTDRNCILPCKYDEATLVPGQLTRVRTNCFYGVANSKGKMLIGNECDDVSYKGRGIFRIEKGDKIGYLGPDKEVVWPLGK